MVDCGDCQDSVIAVPRGRSNTPVMSVTDALTYSNELGRTLRSFMFTSRSDKPTVLDEVNFGGIDLTDSSFAGCELQGCNFANANLSRVNFSDCFIGGTTFAGADLIGARFTEATIDGVDFANACLHNALFDNAVCSCTTFHGARLQGAVFNGCAWDGLEINGVLLDPLYLAPSAVSIVGNTLDWFVSFDDKQFTCVDDAREYILSATDEGVYRGATVDRVIAAFEMMDCVIASHQRRVSRQFYA